MLPFHRWERQALKVTFPRAHSYEMVKAGFKSRSVSFQSPTSRPASSWIKTEKLRKREAVAQLPSDVPLELLP